MATRDSQTTLLDTPTVRDVALQPSQPAGELDPMVSMLERLATNPAVDVDKLRQLIDMQERVLNREAEAAFNSEFAVMQGEIPTIEERASTDKTTYAPLEDIIEVVRPILKAHGFSLSFKTDWPDGGKVKVTGILTHRSGHSRESVFIGGADTSGSKNAIQALGSSVQYGRRYVTRDLLCIVTREEDDDGESSEKHKAPNAPDGYDEFVGRLRGNVAKGTQALYAVWNKAEAKLRQHMTRHDKALWDGLRKQAGQVQL